jgi:hypothetical protein
MLFRLLGLAAVLAGPWPAAHAAEVPFAAPYVPTPDSIVQEMLELAEVGPDDYLIDLGSGDGRIVVTAARDFGARGMGVEIQADLVAAAIRSASEHGVTRRARFAQQDLFATDLSQATVVTMYLLPETVNRLRDKLLTELAPGSRIVSHDYRVEGWRAEESLTLEHPDKVDVTGVARTQLYLYRVPAPVAGRWRATTPAGLIGPQIEFVFTQEIADVGGIAHIDDRVVQVQEGALSGREISFTLGEPRRFYFTGTLADDGRIEGTIEVGQDVGTWHAVRDDGAEGRGATGRGATGGQPQSSVIR